MQRRGGAGGAGEATAAEGYSLARHPPPTSAQWGNGPLSASPLSCPPADVDSPRIHRHRRLVSVARYIGHRMISPPHHSDLPPGSPRAIGLRSRHDVSLVSVAHSPADASHQPGEQPLCLCHSISRSGAIPIQTLTSHPAKEVHHFLQAHHHLTLSSSLQHSQLPCQLSREALSTPPSPTLCHLHLPSASALGHHHLIPSHHGINCRPPPTDLLLHPPRSFHLLLSHPSRHHSAQPRDLLCYHVPARLLHSI